MYGYQLTYSFRLLSVVFRSEFSTKEGLVLVEEEGFRRVIWGRRGRTVVLDASRVSFSFAVSSSSNPARAFVPLPVFDW
jgi:hypothetical protein